MQSNQWKHPDSPPPKTFKRVHSARKVMASIFWDSQGVIMIDYLEQSSTINGAYHADELRRLRQCSALERQRPYPYVTSCMTAATECGFEMLSRPLYILLIWLLLTSICSQN